MSERTICDEIAADAAGLMAMPGDAPERRRAEEHARTHADCARALAEARQLFALIEGKPLPAPAPAALERASAPILKELASGPYFAGLVAAIVVCAWALPLALMRHHITPGVDFYSSIALAALAALTSAIVVQRARRAGVAFIVLSVLTAAVPGDGGGLEPTLGLHCALIETLAAGGAVALSWMYARRYGRAILDARVLTAALGGGALAGHAALEVGCRAAHSASHALLFHTGPVALAVAAAIVMARWAVRRAASVVP
jgi:hypothetical protein